MFLAFLHFFEIQFWIEAGDRLVRGLARHLTGLNAGCLWVTPSAIPSLHHCAGPSVQKRFCSTYCTEYLKKKVSVETTGVSTSCWSKGPLILPQNLQSKTKENQNHTCIGHKTKRRADKGQLISKYPFGFTLSTKTAKMSFFFVSAI